MTKFKQVDVFTTKSFKGNPVAIVMDGQSLQTQQMQEIANWTNLSETTFVLPPKNPKADYALRIFTPVQELPFAGHPTIGTAYALLEEGLIKPKNGGLIQECAAGLIALTVHETDDAPIIFFQLPKPKLTALDSDEIDQLEIMLNCAINRELPPILVDVGARWIVMNTYNVRNVLAAQPDFSRLAIHNKAMQVTGICIYSEWGQNHIEVRSFAPACGANEDPVCGSGNGSVAAFIRHYGKSSKFERTIKSSQGRVLERDGIVYLRITDEEILVGGSAVTCIEGEINLPKSKK
ncbi:PhzF family phenazine biosynthesis protein [Bartonella sp. HY329]|uniref:PhzF family phenazine biosynthesis protein n=1 Tax=unclassified Bartonella TaxID=2645622 RepID=UPI0021CAB85F|nr:MULTISPECIES: PhzF family phenazine biosynthesis protein [unclassified Bartonella]UXM95841.1 PhzF family phenazine biosynthesis protein [Bartonella sp. HY329]UXN10166.1 PhzF family phenazine biosynthesis protein [Bartonella sp. HY328]